MNDRNQMTLTFRCPPGLEAIIPPPIAAVLGLPDWFKALPPKAFNATMGEETQTVKKCPPFIDAMIYGFLIPLAVDLKVQDGEFSWDYEPPRGLASEYPHSPVGFHDPSQVAGTPFFEDDRFIIKFNNFCTIEAPPGYRGGNCEFGTGSARLAAGALSVKPITAQLMSTPTAP